MHNVQDFAVAKEQEASSAYDEGGLERRETRREGAVEDLELGPRATYINTGAAAGISQEHRDYLLKRHGTLDLEPLPLGRPGRSLQLAAMEEARKPFLKLHTSPPLQIAILGWAPLFWKPVSNRYGRRPVWLISTVGSLLFNVGCALSPTYSSMAICRAFTSFFISPAIAIGSGVVTETFFKKQRATYMGMWTLLVTLGPPSGPFFMGFVAYHTGNYRWIYWVLAIVNGIQFIAYLFFGPETRYLRSGVPHKDSVFKQEYLNFKRLDPSPFKPMEFIQPLSLWRYASIWVPTIAYSIVFGFTSVLLTVEIPQLFLPKFGLNPQQIGLQFLGMIVGSVIGEQIGGRLSDLWMNKKAKKLGHRPAPEHRLWLSYFGYALAMVGLIVFGVQIQNATKGHYTVTPIVGVGIAAAGNQLITTVLVTYAVDCHIEHSASIGVFVNVVRSTWGFIGPFWFPDMLESVGGAGSAGIMVGIIFAVACIPTALLQWRGQSWREKKKIDQETEVRAETKARM
ncbi:MFS transporter [Apiospora hydei]|uniref:MFS transporter n=1 Tax=Apiospora hydei TaxID=1337664 RepID=A0ABR1UU14_9PEZI